MARHDKHIIAAGVSLVLIFMHSADLQATPPKHKKPVHNGRVQTVTVPATACIWFTWATDEELGAPGAGKGPHGESVAHRPVAVDVPAGATTISIKAAGTWSHGAKTTGPEGDGAEWHLMRSEYRNFTGANAIQDVTSGHNTLVGVWQIGEGVPNKENSVPQIIIGAGVDKLKVPAGATRLYLAFLDGWEWSNNTGKVNVTLQWEISRQLVTVPATACIWFAWATDDELGTPENGKGPHRESVAHRPVSVAVPRGATAVSIAAEGSWTHGGSTTGPAGSNKSEALKNPAYREFNGADRIQVLDAGLNTFVGMWQIGQGPPGAKQRAAQFVIGEGVDKLKVPQGATRLFLAFHDSYEWSNNESQIEAILNWEYGSRHASKAKSQ